MLNAPVDVGSHFLDPDVNYYFLKHLESFDEHAACGTLVTQRNRRKLRLSFNQEMMPFEPSQGWEFPPDYDQDKKAYISITFISSDTLRIKILCSDDYSCLESDDSSPMLREGWKDSIKGNGWKLISHTKQQTEYASTRARLTVVTDPFALILHDADGNELWRTCSMDRQPGLMNSDPLACCFIQKLGDQKREMAASFSLSHDEKLFGCGESFTRFDKRGQRIVLCSDDPKGVQTQHMYKPIPFYLSNKGYGMFVHASVPMTFDLGSSYDGTQSLFIGQELLDMFVFIGNPRQVLKAYAEITGFSPMPPAWSFGLWMGRITYNSQEEVLQIAHDMRKHRIPGDVIHLDTGWFEQDWRCDFKFDASRFPNPFHMMEILHKEGFHLSLWQLPYFTPHNRLFKEIVDNGYAINGQDGNLPTEDAILDMSNPEAIAWYQDKLAGIFAIGVDVIKADFGESAPYHGRYASGQSGWKEHNLFPLRYNKAVSDITRANKNHRLIWARSAWAGSQRYPLHWGGDAENTNSAMAASLRAGMSFGLSGFPFWSHDIGGFVKAPDPELYLRWLAFGMFSSHCRCHGKPPREPWDFSEKFLIEFRQLVDLRYQFMPYILSQACVCTHSGLPMIRPYFIEFPEDPAAWTIDDAYLFGESILVAPLFTSKVKGRSVYVPYGLWTEYPTGRTIEGGRWIHAAAYNHIVLMVRDGSIIPMAKPAQSVDSMDLTHFSLFTCCHNSAEASGHIPTPDGKTIRISMEKGKLPRAECQDNLWSVDVNGNEFMWLSTSSGKEGNNEHA